MINNTKQKTSTVAIIATVIAAISLTAMNTAIKFAQLYVNHDIIVFTRALFAVVILLPILRINSSNNLIRTRHYSLHLLRAIIGVLSAYCIVLSLETLPISNATLLFMTYPLFTPIMMYLFWRQTVTMPVLLTIILGFIGVIFVLNPTTNGFLQYGSLYSLASSILASMAVLVIKRLSSTEHASQIVLFFALNATVMTIIPAWLHWQPIPLIAWIYLLIVSVSAIIYQQGFAYALKHGEPTTIIAIMYSAIIFSAIVDWVTHEKVMHVSTIVGFILIVSSVLWVSKLNNKHDHK